MFSKLALKNATRSLRDYSIYFLTLTFGVCLFYIFNSLESQWVMQALSNVSPSADQAATMLQTILTLVDVFSAFVSMVLAFLILYANHFMVKRRKKELGTYLLLGLSHRRISSLLFLETMLIGGISLGAGLLLGVFLSQFLSVFTAGLFQLTVTEFYFVFSLKAVGKTIAYFGLIFLLVMVWSTFSVSRAKLIDLIQGARRNETLHAQSVKLSALLFLLSAVLLAVAYWMLLTRGLLQIDALFFVMLGLGSLGTLLFFRALAGFLLQLLQRNERLYLKGLNMFTLRQFAARVGTNYVSMTIICLMLLLSIGITACSVGMNDTLDDLTNAQAPYDFYLSAQQVDWETGETAPVDIPATLKQAGFDPALQLSSTASVEVWNAQVRLPQYIGTQDEFLSYTGILSLSTFNAIHALSGLPPLELPEGTYGQVLSSEDHRTAVMETDPVLLLGGQTLTAAPHALIYEPLSIGYSTGAFFYLIVPDEVLRVPGSWQEDDLILSNSYYCGNYRTDVPKSETETLLQQCISSFFRLALGDMGGQTCFNTKLELYMETMGTKILVLFLGIYLGIVFLLCSAAVLALQQLSQAADNIPRYQILSRLGVSQRQRDHALIAQVMLAFLLPLALAIVHAVVGMTAANAVIASVGKLDAVSSTAVTAVLLVLFYGVYFLATCWGSRRILRDR